MSERFDPDPVGAWIRFDEGRNSVSYRHPETGDVLLLLRVSRPNGRAGRNDGEAEYVLRHVRPDRRGESRDVATVTGRPELEDRFEEAMRTVPDD